VTTTELDRLVAQIGEEILARLGPRNAAAPARAPEGLNLPDAACPGCLQRCPQTCAGNTKRIVAAGADRVSASERLTRVDPEIARLIDHTLLKPEAARDDIVRLCREARQFGFATVCVNPYWVALAAAELSGSPVGVCTVTGFPLGATSTASKVAETAEALRAGAREIDMVINIGALRSGDRDTVKTDIREVSKVCREAGASLKVIIEAALLDDAQKAVACALAREAGADFVKTSTGFGPGGATARDVALMRQVVGPSMGIKAAGGIRTYEDLKRMTEAGATRIGASASVKIVQSAGA
jgi:deoxyribose-phosphate aldolase